MSEIILEKNEFYNPDFNPSLKQLAWRDFRRKLRPWKFHDRGVPAPTLDGDSAAYWLASVSSKNYELPIIAIKTTNIYEQINTDSNVWFSGIVSVSYLREFENDNNGLHRACLGSTFAGPSKLENVLEIFDNLVTAEVVLLPESVYQFSKTLK